MTYLGSSYLKETPFLPVGCTNDKKKNPKCRLQQINQHDPNHIRNVKEYKNIYVIKYIKLYQLQTIHTPFFPGRNQVLLLRAKERKLF